MDKVSKTWRIIDLIKASEKVLKEKNITNPRLNAELLLADTLNTKRINLYLDFEKPLDEKEIAPYKQKLRRRLNHEPLQYITGYAEFYGLKFKVNKNVLIPRPETELLVDKSLELLASFDLINPRILEIGTGSGCISVAIANKINCNIDAIDKSENALEVARENSRANGTGTRINFVNTNIFTGALSFDDYDLVLSNPPYIPISEFGTLERDIKDYEPKYALTDGKDGLEFYRKTIEILNKTTAGTIVLLEIGDGKKGEIEKLLEQENVSRYTFYKDYLDIDRVVKIEAN
jgi:release factor glutamine methyltransferase